jgi:site-specific DNA-methyltransferase (adenine-specific)
LSKYAKEGDTIIDTHGGSMSSVIACIEMGLDIDCWELDEDYFDKAVERILNHVKQLNMFQESPIINIYR